MTIRQNSTSERVLLHYCMRDINNYYYINSKVGITDFQDPKNKLIYDLMMKLANLGITEMTYDQIYAQAMQEEIFDDIGGHKYVRTVIDKMTDVGYELENVNHHISIVKEISKALKLQSLLETRAKELNRENIGQVIESTINDLMFLDDKTNDNDEPMTTKQFLQGFASSLDEEPTELSGLPTGYIILDKQIDGLVPGTLTIIAGEKKAGKSAFLTNIATYIINTLNIPILYIDTEMTDQEWFVRWLSNTMGVKERELKHKNLSDQQKNVVNDLVYESENKAQVYHQYMPGFTVDKIVALVNRFYRKEKIGLVIFDYIKPPQGEKTHQNRSDYHILGEVTTRLKDLAGKLNIPIVTAAQLNRDGGIADSYRILWFADVIAYWEKRPDKESDMGGGFNGCGSHKLIIADSRRGGTTTQEGIGYRFYKQYMTIREVPIDEQYFFKFGIGGDSSEYTDESPMR